MTKRRATINLMGCDMTKSTEYKRNVENDQSASFWLKKALVTAEGRDVLDALADAEQLLEYCQQRAIEAGVA